MREYQPQLICNECGIPMTCKGRTKFPDGTDRPDGYYLWVCTTQGCSAGLVEVPVNNQVIERKNERIAVEKYFYYVVGGQVATAESPVQLLTPVEVELDSPITNATQVEEILTPAFRNKYAEMGRAEIRANLDNKELQESLKSFGLTIEKLEAEAISRIKDMIVFSFSFLRKEGQTVYTANQNGDILNVE